MSNTDNAERPTVYKPSAKGLREAKFDPNERLIFYGTDTALIYNGDRVVQSDLMYRKPDSHLTQVDEQVPTPLKIDKSELAHVRRHNLQLPVEVVEG